MADVDFSDLPLVGAVTERHQALVVDPGAPPATAAARVLVGALLASGLGAVTRWEPTQNYNAVSAPGWQNLPGGFHIDGLRGRCNIVWMTLPMLASSTQPTLHVRVVRDNVARGSASVVSAPGPNDSIVVTVVFVDDIPADASTPVRYTVQVQRAGGSAPSVRAGSTAFLARLALC